jgi:hypothetical protein
MHVELAEYSANQYVSSELLALNVLARFLLQRRVTFAECFAQFFRSFRV